MSSHEAVRDQVRLLQAQAAEEVIANQAGITMITGFVNDLTGGWNDLVYIRTAYV